MPNFNSYCLYLFSYLFFHFLTLPIRNLLIANVLYLFISDHDREPTQNTDSFEKQNGEGKCNVFGILLRIEEISNFFLNEVFFTKVKIV